jgi:uncharacterized protein with HEPN domain
MTAPRRDVRDFVADILAAVEKAGTFVEGFDLATFAADDRTSYAVVRALEVVGEAAKRVPQDVRDAHPDVPWRAMAGMRDKLIHDYITVNLEVVWRTVTEDLPPLAPALRRVLAALDDPSGRSSEPAMDG